MLEYPILVENSDLSESDDIVRQINKNKDGIFSFFNALKWPLYTKELGINTAIWLPLKV